MAVKHIYPSPHHRITRYDKPDLTDSHSIRGTFHENIGIEAQLADSKLPGRVTLWLQSNNTNKQVSATFTVEEVQSIIAALVSAALEAK